MKKLKILKIKFLLYAVLIDNRLCFPKKYLQNFYSFKNKKIFYKNKRCQFLLRRVKMLKRCIVKTVWRLNFI